MLLQLTGSSVFRGHFEAVPRVGDTITGVDDGKAGPLVTHRVTGVNWRPYVPRELRIGVVVIVEQMPEML